MTRKDWLFLFIITGLILANFWDLVTLKQAFLSGDHREQQYPWALFLQEQIRSGMFPWWTSRIQSGFPLLAEGQIGAFYPVNLLFFYFLPGIVAYNYGILFHYILGAGLFYILLRRFQIGSVASVWGTLIYLFASTQGGYFYYNYISQKTVIWLPLTFILIDKLQRKSKPTTIFWLAVVFAFQLTAGYLQVAIYSIGFSCLYFLYRFLEQRNWRFITGYTLAGLLAIILALPQLLPTLELAFASSRAGAPLDLAFVGSMTPAGLLTLFHPSWDGFLGSEIYVGILGLFLAFTTLYFWKETTVRFFILSFFFFTLLAAGKWGGIYSLLVHATHFSGFRTPIKFLFFSGFSLAILSAFGLNAILSMRNFELRRFKIIFTGLVFLSIALPLAANITLTSYRENLEPAFTRYVLDQFHEKAGHPHSQEYYESKSKTFYNWVISSTSFSEKENLHQLLVIFFSLILISSLTQQRSQRFVWLLFLMLSIDLFHYGFQSVKPSFEPTSTIKSAHSLIDIIQKDKSVFRVSEMINGKLTPADFPLLPSKNMPYQIEHVGMYSPLAFEKYRQYAGEWAYVNNSLGAQLPTKAAVLRHQDQLNWMNVKYLFSDEEFNHSKWDFLGAENHLLLYQNKSVWPRAFFLPRKTQIPPLTQIAQSKPVPIEIVFRNEQKVKINHSFTQNGFAVLSETGDRHWTVTIDGKKASLYLIGGLFKAVEVPAGAKEIVFEYQPILYQRLLYVSLLLLALGFMLSIWQKIKTV